MILLDGTLQFERKTCYACQGTKLYEHRAPCPHDGRAQRGVRCVRCGSTTKHHHYVSMGLAACQTCEQTGQILETATDYLSLETWRGLSFRVYRQDRPLTWSEQHLALGCCWTSTDYGRAWRADDEAALIESVRLTTSQMQACKLLRDSNDLSSLPDHIGIFVTREGYSVRPVFQTPEGYAIQRTVVGGIAV